MALTKQASSVLKRVAVDFPVLPRLPKLTISADADAMSAFQTQFDSFYSGLRTTILDKLNAISDRINLLVVPVATPTTPTTTGTSGTGLDAIKTQLSSLIATINSLKTAQAQGRVILLCAAMTPGATGPDAGEIPIPYSDDGSSIAWKVSRVNLRVQTAGGAPSVTIEKSTGAGAFSATSVATVTLGSGDYEASVTGSLGTVSSGDKLRFNALTLDSAQNWTITVEVTYP
jgi:hypothetical protein